MDFCLRLISEKKKLCKLPNWHPAFEPNRDMCLYTVYVKSISIYTEYLYHTLTVLLIHIYKITSICTTSFHIIFLKDYFIHTIPMMTTFQPPFPFTPPAICRASSVSNHPRARCSNSWAASSNSGRSPNLQVNARDFEKKWCKQKTTSRGVPVVSLMFLFLGGKGFIQKYIIGCALGTMWKSDLAQRCKQNADWPFETRGIRILDRAHIDRHTLHVGFISKFHRLSTLNAEPHFTDQDLEALNNHGYVYIAQKLDTKKKTQQSFYWLIMIPT